ncbi:hypothetical protein CROQUDRAFT_132068 [Cronartium quercuum f. sp. fusiforme G11]|uniref:Uncharacterized protein n=1 Tax=Cronartium quercuum f. sp. fusiforme G11 TaxID=708437 RepID=A0A9P6NJN2_9BASI|nr:hypothetical protein CROQUDRAFT_132068 [Cronartium quercuum f. sp. fusiforme G11]
MAFDPHTGLSWGTNPFKETASDPHMAFLGTLDGNELGENLMGAASLGFPNILSHSEGLDKLHHVESNAFMPSVRDLSLAEDALSSGSDNSLLPTSGTQLQLPNIGGDKFLEAPFPDIDLDQPVPDFSNTTAFIDPWRAVTPTAQLDCPYRLTGRNQINFSLKSSVAAPVKTELDGIGHFQQAVTSSFNPVVFNSVCVNPAYLTSPSLTETVTPTQSNALFHFSTNANRPIPSPPSPQTPTKPQAAKLSKKSNVKAPCSKTDKKKTASPRNRNQAFRSETTPGRESPKKAKTGPKSSLKKLEGTFSFGLIDSPQEDNVVQNTRPINKALGAGAANLDKPVAGPTPDPSHVHPIHPALLAESYPNSYQSNGSLPFGISYPTTLTNSNSCWPFQSPISQQSYPESHEVGQDGGLNPSTNHMPFGPQVSQLGSSPDWKSSLITLTSMSPSSFKGPLENSGASSFSKGYPCNASSTTLNPSSDSNPLFTDPFLLPALPIKNSCGTNTSESPPVLMAQSRSDPETYQQTDNGEHLSNFFQNRASQPSFSTPTSAQSSPTRPSDHTTRSLAGLHFAAPLGSFSGIQPQIPQSLDSTIAGLSTVATPSHATASHPSSSNPIQAGTVHQLAPVARSPSPSRPSTTLSAQSTHSKAPPSIFVNFTPKDSKKLLSGVAPSGSSKRKRSSQPSPSTPSKRRGVTT